MSDIKLVIKIPEETYNDIQSLDWKNGERWYSEECKAIHYGTLLPKGHGRIGDLDVLKQEMINSIKAGLEKRTNSSEKPNRWIPVSERLPEKHGVYLVTIESGDVFDCYFNPDYCCDGHDSGAFTYTQEYFDRKTMGSLGSEEFVFDDVVAWMSYEPYKAESEG